MPRPSLPPSAVRPAVVRPAALPLVALPLAAALVLSACTGPSAAAGAAGPSASPSPSSVEPSTPASGGHGEAAPAHWSYTGAEGPEHWAELSDEYGTCTLGEHQSPVDLPAVPPAPTAQVELTTGAVTGAVADTGHVLQLTATGSEGGLVHEGRALHLVQLHAHTPAEHTVAGEAVDAEVHLVHEDAEGLLVVGVRVRTGAPSPAWETFLEGEGSGAPVRLDTADLLPAGGVFWSYAGSLTTPPCSEPVRWVVLADTVEMSAEQLAALGEAHGDSARPVQDLGDREVTAGVLVRTAG
ncbi:carbonic anhydrase [Cellulomonas endophytica]|uniref:carbonic anhydrase n=1 Tax=Cellulomonas endophytica TaxID=2494735 RepID=UPI001012797A|nr:carbonic anhydrase family protein [Cellulomonas endophytica]